MKIQREIYPTLKKYLKKKEIIALTGSRQVGKTTLMEELYKNIPEPKKFISFEDEMTLNQFENNIKSFEKINVEKYKYLFIDEFQYAKEGGKKLKYLYDKHKTKIIISGSSAPELSIQTISHLTGRVFVFEIYPLNFQEYLTYKNKDLARLNETKINNKDYKLLNEYFEEFLKYGGYPQIILQETKEEKEFALKNLINNYLLKEIKDVLEYKTSYEFENVLKFLAVTDATILNKSNISSDLGIHINKITEMIEVLKKTYVLNVLKPYKDVKIKELIKSPKTYFLDTGFKNVLINNFNELKLRVDKGNTLENFVLSELTKKGITCKYYNYKNRTEIDFLIEKNNKIIGMEVKSNLSTQKIGKNIHNFIDKINPEKIIILNLNIEGKAKIKNTEIIFTNILNVVKHV